MTRPTASEPTEAQVERVEDAVREAMESRQGGLVPLGGQAWGEPDDYWISMHVGPVARAALTAAAKVGGE